MTNEELDYFEKSDRALRLSRDAMDLQLRRWRDGDSVCAVQEMQEARNACQDIVGKRTVSWPTMRAATENVKATIAPETPWRCEKCGKDSTLGELQPDAITLNLLCEDCQHDDYAERKDCDQERAKGLNRFDR